MDRNSLPMSIGSTENTLRALLTELLSDTAIHSYEEWVYLNVGASTSSPASIASLVANLLKQSPEVVEKVARLLWHRGLINADGMLLPGALDELEKGRHLVGSATASLVAELEQADIETTFRVLAHIKQEAEQLLTIAHSRNTH